jgi:hypothetical protein
MVWHLQMQRLGLLAALAALLGVVVLLVVVSYAGLPGTMCGTTVRGLCLLEGSQWAQ